MRQQRMCETLKLSCKHPDTLLRLPQSIRARIFLYAGLITNGCIILGPRRVWYDIPDEQYEVTWHLLQVSKALRAEVTFILCTYNCFLLPQEHILHGLRWLRQLSPDACFQLYGLFIHLRSDREYLVPGQPSPPSLTWEVIELWQTAITHVLSNVEPRRLCLTLICDTTSSRKTTAVLEPLQAFPGIVRQLELRLDFEHHQHLATLARETCLRAMYQPLRADMHFPFFRLPRELRRHILDYTNLVTPYRHVQWSPNDGFGGMFPYCECDGDVCGDEDLHCGSEIARCEALFSDTTGACCSQFTSGYSSRCHHRVGPSSLMLVSRAFSAEAMECFFANNRVTIIPSGDELFGDIAPGDAQEIALDLFVARYARSDLLRHLRTLELFLPAIRPKSALEGAGPEHQNNWCRAVERLATMANGPRLTFIIHLWTTLPHSTKVWPLDEPNEEISEKIRLSMFRSQRQTLAPLQALKLQRLFVHLEWPIHWSPPKLLDDISKFPKVPSPGCGIGLHIIQPSRPRLAKMERWLERTVMGDEYDSRAWGKADQLPSPTLRCAWNVVRC